MDKIPNQREIPDVVLEAYYLLLQHRIVTITKPIRENLDENATGWMFECAVKVMHPNQEGLPCEVFLRVLIPEVFPREPIEVYSISEEVSGFPHQEAESRKLCLPEEDVAPQDASRLVCYVKWTLEWLEDAAKGTLLKPGDPYELPDFRHKLLDSSLLANCRLVFEEWSNSYESWKPYIGASGNIECFLGEGIPAIFAVRFSDKAGSLIRESEFRQTILRKDGIINGKWALVPNICYERHRPPQTYGEMEDLCTRNNVDFYALLKDAWYLKHSYHFGVLLIGFPIPKTVGEMLAEIHWQPLLFQNLKGFRAQKPRPRLKGSARKPKQIWKRLREEGCYSLPQQLPWAKVENVARERLYARGSQPSKVQSTPIAIFGCGALGSSVAELLARGGGKRLNLFDPDLMTFGNLCRHTLDGSSVGLNKAEALAKRLSRTNPLSTIIGHAVGIPLDSQSDETLHQVLVDAHLFVDCTTSYAAFGWLNEYAVENCKRLISLFFNLHAELLTICISGESSSCGEIFEDLRDSVKRKRAPLDPDVYFHKPSREEEIMEGAGCWHPSFPALNTHVQILAAHAVDILGHSLDSNQKIGLAAIVKRRSAPPNSIQTGPLVEVVWTKEYP